MKFLNRFKKIMISASNVICIRSKNLIILDNKNEEYTVTTKNYNGGIIGYGTIVDITPDHVIRIDASNPYYSNIERIPGSKIDELSIINSDNEKITLYDFGGKHGNKYNINERFILDVFCNGKKINTIFLNSIIKVVTYDKKEIIGRFSDYKFDDSHCPYLESKLNNIGDRIYIDTSDRLHHKHSVVYVNDIQDISVIKEEPVSPNILYF